MVYHEEELPQVDYGSKVKDDELKNIGQLIAGMIEDGSTLQMGIGTIPDAVLKALHNHKDLGVHTEMCSDGIIDLFDNDVINNTKKRIHLTKPLPGLQWVHAGCMIMWMIIRPSFSLILIM